MRAIFGGKGTEDLNRMVSPRKQNRFLFALFVLLMVFGIFYVLSFYFW